MDTLFEILKIVLPAITAGLFTFFVTRYTYNNNRPLDKLEIAYNRVYYPIYTLIMDKNKDIDDIINRSETYIKKYNKYVDMSTKRLFEMLSECTKETKKKSIYQNFKDNIYSKNTYLRRRLGYLEPNFIHLYKSSSIYSRCFFRVMIEVCVLYISFILSYIIIDIFKENIDQMNVFFYIPIALLFISIIVIILEILRIIALFLYYTIRK